MSVIFTPFLLTTTMTMTKACVKLYLWRVDASFIGVLKSYRGTWDTWLCMLLHTATWWYNINTCCYILFPDDTIRDMWTFALGDFLSTLFIYM